MHKLIPEAYFDSICLMEKVKPSLVPVSVSELHLYAYLSCIIALWRGQAIGDWGYSFALTSEGFPFSPEFEQGRLQLIKRGHATVNENGEMLPERKSLSEEIANLFSHERWERRHHFLETATECALSLPSGSIRYAIGQSPGFGSAVDLKQNSPLLTGFDIDAIYGEYQIVSEALGGENIDLLSPAIIWLSARVLQEQGA